jgi:hypothetical protein
MCLWKELQEFRSAEPSTISSKGNHFTLNYSETPTENSQEDVLFRTARCSQNQGLLRSVDCRQTEVCRVSSKTSQPAAPQTTMPNKRSRQENSRRQVSAIHLG